ncbi:helix-turn-helix domain-containing protein [Tumebacillus permanentifrigoris]|uniref:Helix-turn-helix protein n=1 Tax=Tumebacillus permanentifrigoris TaxID=378543 RepID=A0A316D7F6_9BACL|nr:helix-turn-helix transcriptional regulator [Tumebacillus permanentifrigoris]PWK09008.1 helix-turn-helix protein [Tumebacillus permanentifrigoris]
MSTIEHTESCAIGKIPLGRRISEILDERGKAHNVPAFSKRVGISESTLYRILSGKRTIKPSELAIISKHLKISIERIKQEDTYPLLLELRNLVIEKKNMIRAKDIAQSLLSNAVGYTERFEILNYLGKIHYHLKHYMDSHKAWVEALPHAERIVDVFQDMEPLKKITGNLISSFTKIKDYSGMAVFLQKVHSSFHDSVYNLEHEFMGTLCLSYAITAYNLGDKMMVQQKLEKSLEYYIYTGDTVLIGKGQHNIAYHNFLEGKFHQSKSLFEKDLQTLDYLLEPKLIARKDYIKVLLKLNERALAFRLIEDSLVEVEKIQAPQLKAKLLLLRAVAKNDLKSAEGVLLVEDAGDEQIRLAFKFIMDYYSQINDDKALMKYYKIAGEYLNKSAIFDWEGFIR